MGMVRFPTHAHWCERARQECLKFPQSRHDDFVDALAHIGLGLDRIVRAPQMQERTSGPVIGTMGWVKAAANIEVAKKKLSLTLGGM